MSTEKQRNEFETKLNSLIKNKINNFNECSKNYQMATQKIYSESLDSKYIILENPTIIDNIENEFPYYYELLSIPLVNEDHLKENLFFIENVLDNIPENKKKLIDLKKNK